MSFCFFAWSTASHWLALQLYLLILWKALPRGVKEEQLLLMCYTFTYTWSTDYFVTTDLRHRCTDGHTGTSVSAPIVAGIIALALEANFLLTWRDVQHLLVKTSRPAHLKADDWKTNAAGLRVSHLYGFGLVDAEAMVLEATKWTNVPPQHTCIQMSELHTRYIRAGQSLNSSVTTSGCSGEPGQLVHYLEHVVVKVLIVHPRRGDLEINLISPSGTRSQLLARRLFDNSNEGFRNWEFMTVHFWGERPQGTWTLEVVDSPLKPRNREVLGNLKEWTMNLYGTSQNPYQLHRSPINSKSKMSEISAPDELLEEPELQDVMEEYNGPCHHQCEDQGCDGPDADHCLNCVHFSSGSSTSSRTCGSRCPLGHYEDIASHHCRHCYEGCEKCVGPLAGDCLSCRRGFYLNALNSSCINICPPGYFTDESQRQCQRCHSMCMTCMGFADRCTACKEGYRIAGMTCVPECSNGTFFNVGEMTCRQCHPSCKTCTGPDTRECIHCAEGFLQQEWSCVQTCSPGYYYGEAAGVPHKMCHRCEDNCLRCHGSGTTCTKCKEGYSLISRTCIVNALCVNAEDVFCDMVKSNRLCEKKLYRQFCCRTCLMNG